MPTAIPTVELHPSAATRTLPRPTGFKPVSVSVGLDGSAIRLLVPDETADAVLARVVLGLGSFPKTKTEEEYSSIVVVSGPAGIRELRLSGLTATFPSIEMLPGNECLVVAPRCQCFSDGTYEFNAKVYDSSGVFRREFLLGDGIEHVQADARGNIWVGYFDEGVYGNFGWGHPGRKPLGAAGLCCFSDSGQKLWDFPPPEEPDFDSECYGLNVSRRDVWTLRDASLPFVRIDSNWQVRCWEQTGRAGGDTFAVGDQSILFYRRLQHHQTGIGAAYRYRPECKLCKIGDKEVELVADVSLVLPAEVELWQSTVIGRDTELHVFSGDDWYRFSVESLR